MSWDPLMSTREKEVAVVLEDGGEIPITNCLVSQPDQTYLIK